MCIGVRQVAARFHKLSVKVRGNLRRVRKCWGRLGEVEGGGGGRLGAAVDASQATVKNAAVWKT